MNAEDSSSKNIWFCLVAEKKTQGKMEIDLTPKSAKEAYGSNGGSYLAWSPSELPMLGEGNIGAAKIILHQHGFALPSYSDSSKVAYVLQGIFGFLFEYWVGFFFHSLWLDSWVC